MQREDPDGIVILCDFCRRDWDGQEAMIEGHHGSILCLECLKIALRDQHADTRPEAAKYKCNLCLRFNIPPTVPQWRNPAHPDSILCQECLYQGPRAFSRNPDIAWTFDPSQYLPAIKLPKPPKEPKSNEPDSTEPEPHEPE